MKRMGAMFDMKNVIESDMGGEVDPTFDLAKFAAENNALDARRKEVMALCE
jgi:hypothetical protein